MDVMANNFIPGDSRLIDEIVYELKSQGIFDNFRKECISDVDTKPAYQNLRQRVEGCVSGFLKEQGWSPELNKNQLREQLRKNIYEAGFLELGLERIVDQVVNPKINSVFLPKVEDVVYGFLGLEKPVRPPVKKELSINVFDLLPTDLEAISPESDHGDRKDNSDNSLDVGDNTERSGDKHDGPLQVDEPVAMDTSTCIPQEEISADSNLSGFSGLQSHESCHSSSDFTATQMELSNQEQPLTQTSSTNHSCEDISVESARESGQEEAKDQFKPEEIKPDKPQATSSEENTSETNENTKTEVTAHNKEENNEVQPKKKEDKEKSDKPKLDVSSSSKRDKDKDKHKSHKSSSHDKDKRHSSNKEKDTSRDRDKNKEKDSGKEKEGKSSSSSKTESSSSSKKEHKSKKHESSSHKGRDKSDKSKDRSEKDRKDSKEKEKDKNRSSSSKHSSSNKSSSSSVKREHSSSSNGKDAKTHSSSKTNTKKSSSDSKSKSSTSNSEEHKKNQVQHANSNHKKSKDRKSSDDHYSAKEKKTDRRSTDRDSNDGSSSSNRNNSSKESYSSTKKDNREISKHTEGGSSGDSGNSDAIECKEEKTEEAQSSSPQFKYIKPKFASNIHEARKLIKIRKRLAKLERQNQLNLTNVESESLPLEQTKESVIEKDTSENSEQPGIVPIVSENLLIESTLKGTDMTTQSWEAFEKILALEMSQVNNSYAYPDEDCEDIEVSQNLAVFSPIKEKQCVKSELVGNEETSEETTQVRCDETSDKLDEKPPEEQECTAADEEVNPDSSECEERCTFLEKPLFPELYKLTYLNGFIATLEENIKRQKLNVHNNVPKMNTLEVRLERKRKLDEAIQVNIPLVEQNKESGTNVFSFPLSPAESDKSNEANKDGPCPVTEKRKRNNQAAKASVAKRYSTEELYKPRPVFTASRRRGIKN